MDHDIFSAFYTEVMVGEKRQWTGIFVFPGESLEQAAELVGWKLVEGARIYGPKTANLNSLGRPLRRCAKWLAKRMRNAGKLRIKANLFIGQVAVIKDD